MITLVIDNVYFSYDSIEALKGVSLKINQGTILGVLGPNGAGKSTLLKCLCKVLEPTRGVILIDGNDITKINYSSYAKLATALLTEFRIEEELSVLEILLMGRYPYLGIRPGIPEKELNIVEYYARHLGLINLLNRRFSQLSDGERQKVLLARALIQQPKLLILDEPVAHLDIRHQVEILNLIYKWCKESRSIVVMAMHDINLASIFCDLILLLKEGKVYAVGRPEDVLTKENICKVYDTDNILIIDNPYRHYLPMRCNYNNLNIRVHVVGGGGTASKLLSTIAMLIGSENLTCGVLHVGDYDYIVANIMGIEMIAENPFNRISREKLRECIRLVELANIVIDSGFPIGEINRENLKILEYALTHNKLVITLRDHEEWSKLSLPLKANNPKFVRGINDILELVKEINNYSMAE